jgi:NAD(P)-dependent dehydrogenase (short-subunit alcohol dehydrogenase family)
MDTRTAVITGGAQGIGKAIALRLLSKGMRVFVADADPEAAAEFRDEHTASDRLHVIETDVADEAQVRRLADQVRGTTAGLDLLVNNAAIGRGMPVAELPLDDWNRVLAVNLTGPFLCAKHFAGALRTCKGSIVNIASTRAFMSEPNTEAYAASKGGLVALTHALAASLAPDVRVNCISPGWIETESWRKSSTRRSPALSEADQAQHFAGRVGRPEDVAALADFLAFGESGFMTGANLMLDGGMTRKMIYV